MSTKKGGASAKTQRQAHTYEVRDIVLGKVRGYAPWPGMVVDPDSVPSSVAEERPANKKTTFYCVRFFPTGDYAWLVEKDISKLQPKEINDYVGGAPASRRSGDLLEGYKIALDPTKWIEQKAAQAAAAALDNDEEADNEVDQLNSGDETTTSTATKTKKRKRETESASAKTKSTKAKSGKKEPAAKETASGKKAAASSRGRKGGAKSKETIESEDDGGEDEAGTSKKTSPPPAKRPRRGEKEEDAQDSKGEDPEAIKVRDWRHKLQKSFLSNKAVPKDDDMPGLDELFKMIEDFEGMTIEHLQFSKIGKVMRHIAALPEDKVPRDHEFKFRERSDVLVKKWHQILNATKGANGADAGLGPAPVTNGTAKEDKAEKDEKAVMDGTAALDLNGKEEDAIAEGDAADAPGEADTTAMDGDVTMSEA
ncbi:hypothetical protein BKA70DRAFT_1337292 [Coprinopsis sp. MPI-PUGE-AT-0042]|nr:hypothetical protein BKA70DRAFT_1337292 [Coprinopsis sp. MPI-PUGE-AT-0042]